jgi:hypothetical protein
MQCARKAYGLGRRNSQIPAARTAAAGGKTFAGGRFLFGRMPGHD